VNSPATVALGLVFGAAAFAGVHVMKHSWHVDDALDVSSVHGLTGVLGALGLVLSVQWHDSTVLAMVALTLATIGILTTLPLFWSLPTAFLAGTGAAAGIALINSLGNLAGFLSPYAVGWLKDMTHSTDSGMYLLAACLVVGAALTLSVPARLVGRKS